MSNRGQAAIASIFQGCIFFIDRNARLFVPEVLSGEQKSQEFADTSVDALAEQITRRGGTVLSEFDVNQCTHFVTDDIKEGSTAATHMKGQKAGSKWQLRPVTAEWVYDCIRKDKLMECGKGINGIDSQRHIFSAVVACLSGFRGQERSRIYDHIIRGGGTVTTFLTQSCTHLITSELRGAKCHTAMSLPNIKIVSFLWFKRSVTNGRKEKEDSYDARAPLNDLISAPIPLLEILHTHGKQVFMGMRFYIEEDVAATAASEIMVEAKDALLLHGGAIAESVNDATHILVDTIADLAKLKGSQNNLLTPARRTSKWVLECCRMRTTVWPSNVLEWKGWDFLPHPRHGIPHVEGVNTFVITLTGYTGLHREILKKLIEKSGAQCTPALTRGNTHLLCNTPTSKKAVAANNWGVKVVNHLWIMDSILTWTWQPCDNYSRSGQDILAEGGIWTLLDQATLNSDSFLPHPRYIAEKTWPLPKDVNAAEESEIAGTSEESASPEEEGASNAQDSKEGIEETQSSQEGLQAVAATPREYAVTGRAAVCAAADEETFVESVKINVANVAISPNLDTSAPIPVQAALVRSSVSFNLGASGGCVRTNQQESQQSKEDDDTQNGSEEEEVDVLAYSGASSLLHGACGDNEVSTRSHCRADRDQCTKSPFASQAASHVLLGIASGEEVSQGEEQHEENYLNQHQSVGSANPVSGGPCEQPCGSPNFGESKAAPHNRNSLHGSKSSLAKGARNLAKEFQYDLEDEATQKEVSDPDDKSAAEFGDAMAQSPGTRTASRSSAQCPAHVDANVDDTQRARDAELLPVHLNSSNGRGRGTKIGQHDTASAPSAEVHAETAAVAAVADIATDSPGTSSAQKRARRKSSRGKGHSLGEEDVLENIMHGDYESMTFGHYADPEGVESVAFDGEYDQLNAVAASASAIPNPNGGQRRNAPLARPSAASSVASLTSSPAHSYPATRSPKTPVGRTRGTAVAATTSAADPTGAIAARSKSKAGNKKAMQAPKAAGKAAAIEAARSIAADTADNDETKDSNPRPQSVTPPSQNAPGNLRSSPACKRKRPELKEQDANTLPGRTRGAARAPGCVGKQAEINCTNSKKAEQSSPPGQRAKRARLESGLEQKQTVEKGKINGGAAGGGAQNQKRSAHSSPSSGDAHLESGESGDERRETPSAGAAAGRLLGTRRVSASKASKEQIESGEGQDEREVKSARARAGGWGGSRSFGGGKRSSPVSSTEEQPLKRSAPLTQLKSLATQQRQLAATQGGGGASEAAGGCARQHVVLSGTRVATRTRYVLVCGRTAERAAQAAAVRHLGGQSAYVHGFVPQATHIIVKELRRTEKFLCACAAGRWVLKPTYIEQCKINNQWLLEQSFEWNNPRKIDKDQKELWHGAPRRWRQFWEQNNGGPFTNHKYLLMPDTHPPHEVLTKIISAGSGQVFPLQQVQRGISLADVQKQVQQQGITHVVVADKLDTSISKWLEANKLPVFKGEYILDYLALKCRPSHNDPRYKPEL